ncbi:MAG: dihydrofolate reductase [Candidatus Roizmanbacteria bacterium]|nr:dihydrofolate reductase [Candidatus Roizmanbacteria bacterium]
MKIIIMMVSTMNGKITDTNDPDIYKWTSKEDKSAFMKYISKSSLIVMGRKTYEAAKNIIRLNKNQRRIVLTKDPHNYISDEVPGQLEFMSKTPKNLVKELNDEGYSQMLLVGGSTTNFQFLQEELVNEIHLTVEPLIFGSGVSFIDEAELKIQLQLKSMKRLNSRGTIVLKYKVLN